MVTIISPSQCGKGEGGMNVTRRLRVRSVENVVLTPVRLGFNSGGEKQATKVSLDDF